MLNLELFGFFWELDFVGFDDEIGGLTQREVVSRDDEVVIPGVVGIDAKVLTDELVVFVLDGGDPGSRFFTRLFVFVFVGVVDAGGKGGRDADSQTLVRWQDEVGSVTEDDEITPFGGMAQEFFELGYISDIRDIIWVEYRMENVGKPTAAMFVDARDLCLGDT